MLRFVISWTFGNRGYCTLLACLSRVIIHTVSGAFAPESNKAMPRQTSRCVRKIKESTHTPPGQARPGQAKPGAARVFVLIWVWGLGCAPFWGWEKKNLKQHPPPTERGEERGGGKRKGKEKEEKKVVTCYEHTVASFVREDRVKGGERKRSREERGFCLARRSEQEIG